MVSLFCAPAPRPAPAPIKPPAAPPKQVEYWPRFDESQRWPTSADDWFISEGHYAGTSEARVHVTEEALEQYRRHSRGSTFGPGTTIVMFHRKRSNRTPGPVHAMIRGPNTWEYLLLGADGRIEQRGDLPLCHRCHSEAVSDSVFGAGAAPSAE